MPPVPLITPKEAIKAFEKFGWMVDRQKGSHIVMTKPGQLMTLSIPNHQEVARGTLRSLITKAGLTIDQFLKEI